MTYVYGFFIASNKERYSAAVATVTGLTVAGFPVAILCGLLTPKEPLNLFPFAVFLSPLPMFNLLLVLM